VLAATNADLEKRVTEGRFREDLFYRLNVIPLTVPTLRERPEDILTLAEAFLAYFNQTRPKPFLGFTAEGKAALKAHPWPGNVRELRNAVERAVILCSGDRIGSGDLPGRIGPDRTAPAIGDRVPLAEIEEQNIRRILANTASLQEAAEVLGIDQATLWRRHACCSALLFTETVELQKGGSRPMTLKKKLLTGYGVIFILMGLVVAWAGRAHPCHLSERGVHPVFSSAGDLRPAPQPQRRDHVRRQPGGGMGGQSGHFLHGAGGGGPDRGHGVQRAVGGTDRPAGPGLHGGLPEDLGGGLHGGSAGGNNRRAGPPGRGVQPNVRPARPIS